ncbi:predicted protein [Histoplasma mississippiense (nom. inval.)]|uniref:predicted protein n=1 Tax=Ajellomyces capsulatus (strain NAm1 / WU24) TaxID=2059318 RepID=UPI000157B623|nr:predicted protein [Histoplasma mississippiense (nom. inval.)]EDN02436.1 predicted protein [Histoplasma mississippiense (nom. inval.)]
MPSEFEFNPHTHKDHYPSSVVKWKVLSHLATPAVWEKIQCTLFTQGVFYDYYSLMTEDGKRHESSESLVLIEFDIMVDLRNCRAELVDGMEEKRMQLTAIDDVEKFVAKALKLEEWPDQFMMSEENLTCKELIEICEKVRGKPFEIEWISVADMESKIEEAEKVNDVLRTFIWTTPLRILEGDF